MSKTRNHSITYADLNEVIDVLIDDRTALKRGIMSLIDQAFKEGKNPPKTTKQSAEEIYLEKAVKMCKYPAFLYGRYISVPVGKEDDAMDDLTISLLVNQYKFSIQPCIPDSVQEVELFNPTFREKQESEYSFEVELPKRGEVWKFGTERWYFKQVTDKQFGITFLESLKPDTVKGIEDISGMVVRGELKNERII